MARKKKNPNIVKNPNFVTKLELMSYGRRKTYLNRCICVVKLLDEYETDTSVRCRVFEKYIKPIMNISYVTLNNMLNEPNPQKQILEIDEKIKSMKKPPISMPIEKKAVVVSHDW